MHLCIYTKSETVRHRSEHQPNGYLVSPRHGSGKREPSFTDGCFDALATFHLEGLAFERVV